MITLSRLLLTATAFAALTLIANAQDAAPEPTATADDTATEAAPIDPRMAVIHEQLEQMKAQGASDVELLLIGTMGYFQLGLSEQAAENVVAIKAAIPGIEEADGVSSDNARAARAIVLLSEGHAAWNAKDMKTAEAKFGAALIQLPEITAAIAGEWINQSWHEQKLADITVPMDGSFEIATGGDTTLGAIAEGNKALYIDFWASWCTPCMVAMPELIARTAKYTPEGIAFVAINMEGIDEAKETAEKLDIASTKLHWLVETEAFPLSMLLNVTGLPRAVLISPDGKVLWMGHPADPALVVKLDEITGE